MERKWLILKCLCLPCVLEEAVLSKCVILIKDFYYIMRCGVGLPLLSMEDKREEDRDKVG